MELGSQRLYADAREKGFNDFSPPEPQGEQFEIDIPGLNQEPTGDEGISLPPTLDKLLNGFDTAPIEDEWLAEPSPRIELPVDAPEAPRQAAAPKQKRESRRARRRKRRSGKKSVGSPRNNREIVAISAEMAGIVALSAGFWQIAPWCGLICLGLCLILIGVSISRDSEAA